MKEDKAFFEKSVSRLENPETRENELELQINAAKRFQTEYGKRPEVFEFIDRQKNEILNKTTRLF